MTRNLRLVAALAAIALVAAALAGAALARPGGGEATPSPLNALLSAILVQERHTERLLDRPGVVGTAVGLDADGQPAVVIYRGSSRVRNLPRELGAVPTLVRTVGRLRLLEPQSPAADAGPGPGGRRYPRPVPIGVSIGNAGECSAGTIGARVTDGERVYLLSNNHVLASENDAPLGSDVVHPGRADTGCSLEGSDDLGDLSSFQAVDASRGPLDPLFGRSEVLSALDDGLARAAADNLIDAAIALTTAEDLGTATPPGGYGEPSSKTITAEAALGQAVQKYGRSTGLTKGKVVAINGVAELTYAGGTARFVDQLIVQSTEPFLDPGDSGSLLVTDPGRRPAGLLFAGNAAGTVALANEIDHVLDAFGVRIDGEPSSPAEPLQPFGANR